jgi:hypothetical protein
MPPRARGWLSATLSRGAARAPLAEACHGLRVAAAHLQVETLTAGQ